MIQRAVVYITQLCYKYSDRYHGKPCTAFRAEQQTGAEMRAVVFTSEGELALEERAQPTPGRKEILSKTAAVGICGTDTHVLDGEFEGTVFPLVPGHEATGTIVALGEAVNDGVFDFQIGDKVA